MKETTTIELYREDTDQYTFDVQIKIYIERGYFPIVKDNDYVKLIKYVEKYI